MNIKEYLKNNIVYLDGGLGTLLQSAGLKPGELPEYWNMSHSDVLIDIHKAYYDAGSNVVSANTFGANSLKFSDDELDEIVRTAIANVRTAAEKSNTNHEKFVALDIGPTGKLLAPLGDFDFEEAVSVFAKTVKLGVKYGADLVLIETMNDSYETKAALLAVKENCDLPVFVSNAYSEDGNLMTGASPECMVAMLEGMGADAIGVNCSLGPKALEGVIERYLAAASVPVLFKPNAGLPKVVDGKTVYDVSPSDFAEQVTALIDKGVAIAGGCCGTTPEYIASLTKASAKCKRKDISEKNITVVTSYAKAVVFDKEPVLIGERINPTGKKRFKQALVENDMGYILNEGINQQEKGVHILDVNVGLPDIDEPAMLESAVCELQAVTDLPLQIDTTDPVAMEKALRRYNGKAMINSVNGKQEVMDAIFPLVKKYGGLVVALTLDETGIPETADGRIEIAQRIISEAEKYGIKKKDLIFDTLAMTISASPEAAKTTLSALDTIKNKLGCHTSLGVSNISFGLPNRDIINGTFFAMALSNGLSAAIMNPYSVEMMKTYYAFRAINQNDDKCVEYINFAQTVTTNQVQTTATAENNSATGSDLQKAIIKGLKKQAEEITQTLLKEKDGMEIVQNEIIPALNTVGEGFEKNTVYLPQLLMSAEAAGASFEKIKSTIDTSANAKAKCEFVIATVKGDIHDIGKNIVKLILENYGFSVTDLGRDVEPEVIVDKIIELKAPLAGLSALMTTTVPAMEETIALIHQKAPWCKVVVGGAVLNQEYADKIHADKYARDAMETVRYADEINLTLN